MRQGHATVAARRILQAIAQHIENDPELQALIADLLSDEFEHVVQQTIDDLSSNQPPEDQT
jgi:hypothetical protein